MWHALRAELDYMRAYLLVAFSIAIAVALMVNVLVLISDGPSPDNFVAVGLPGLFMVIAAMVVGFITQGFRSEERRSRLLLTGPLTPRQLAGVMVLLPTTLIGLGLVAAGLSIGVVSLVLGRLQPETLRIVAGVAGQFFAIVQLGPLAQESTAARRQRRNRASLAGWVVFAASILVLVACQWYLHSAIGHLTQVLVGVTAMAASATLCVGRTDFTR